MDLYLYLVLDVHPSPKSKCLRHIGRLWGRGGAGGVVQLERRRSHGVLIRAIASFVHRSSHCRAVQEGQWFITHGANNTPLYLELPDPLGKNLQQRFAAAAAAAVVAAAADQQECQALNPGTLASVTLLLNHAVDVALGLAIHLGTGRRPHPPQAIS